MTAKDHAVMDMSYGLNIKAKSHNITPSAESKGSFCSSMVANDHTLIVKSKAAYMPALSEISLKIASNSSSFSWPRVAKAHKRLASSEVLNWDRSPTVAQSTVAIRVVKGKPHVAYDHAMLARF